MNNNIKTNVNILLEKNEGVLVPELIWDSQKFLTKKSQLVVFCSTNYDHDDYIFDFDKFIKHSHQNSDLPDAGVP